MFVQGIIKHVMGQTDKQSVPANRQLIQNRRFHAELLRDGHTRSAIFLSVMNGAFEALEKGHLEPVFRDYLIDRARYMLYRIVGPAIEDVQALRSCGGKLFYGIEANLVFRLLSSFDARSELVGRLGLYPNDRCMGTNSVECTFSELVLVTGGYMPKVHRGVHALRQVERRLLSKMSGEILQHTSRRKKYPMADMKTRLEWFDGQRQDSFWRLEEMATVEVVVVEPKGQTTHTRGARATSSVTTSNRAMAKAKAAAAGKVAGVGKAE